MIKDNILRIQDDISLICRRLGRNPQDVTLVAVTKFATPAAVEEALACGVEHIGENKVQEAKNKFAAVNFSGFKVTRHMIGHLQTNKVKEALKIFDVIQSVDSLHLAQALDKETGKLNRKADILVQVNTSGEKQKSGVGREAALGLIGQIATLKNLRVLGLMTIAPLVEDEKIIRDSFRHLRGLRDKVNNEFKGNASVQMNFLSMGMSHDYKIAIEEGSNMVRIGSAIFK